MTPEVDKVRPTRKDPNWGQDYQVYCVKRSQHCWPGYLPLMAGYHEKAPCKTRCPYWSERAWRA